MVVEGKLLDVDMMVAAAAVVVVEDDLVFLIGLSFEVKLIYTSFKVHVSVLMFYYYYLGLVVFFLVSC